MSRLIEAFADDNSLGRRLFLAQQEIIDRYTQQKELEEMEERIFNKVMEKVNIQIVNDASPAIDKLKKEIDKSLSNL